MYFWLLQRKNIFPSKKNAFCFIILQAHNEIYVLVNTCYKCIYLENVCKVFTAQVEMLHISPSKTKAFFNLLCCMM